MKTRFTCLVLALQILDALLFGSFSVKNGLAAQTPVAANANAQAQNMMHAFLKQEAVRLDATFLEGITNRSQWEARSGELRQQYLQMLGLWPLPERTPLQAQITGVVERPEGFRVENVHFQSRPHLYVTGNLYLPKAIPAGAKLPAVLYVCGHASRGRDGGKVAFQHHGIWFAMHGYACLIIDTLQLGEIAAIHHGTYRHNRWWWQARGYSPAAVECWNGMRALDYLQSRSEVDGERIAVTGISGGGAASFWIAAADERVKVAAPVSGMADLEDYVGEKVVNGHCDCMFLINAFQWPWTQIAALVAPRPLLFANSGHDPIFPMNGNDRIRSRLERLYGFYTNKTENLFDIGVTPGGHDDKPELRLMAYRWIERHLRGSDLPVTEAEVPPIEGKRLRAFPEELPADELNTTVDEWFVAKAVNSPPQTAEAFRTWRFAKLSELQQNVFPSLKALPPPPPGLRLDTRDMQSGTWPTEPGITVTWRWIPARSTEPGQAAWLVVLGEDDPLDSKPEWLAKTIDDAPMLLIAPRGAGPSRWQDPAPYYIQRSLPLLGRTLDSCRLADILAATSIAFQTKPVDGRRWKIIGRGAAGILAAYAALLDSRLAEVAVVEPPVSHRDGPFFLNVMRVVDIPEALALLAPRPLTIHTPQLDAFDMTASSYRVASGTLNLRGLP